MNAVGAMPMPGSPQALRAHRLHGSFDRWLLLAIGALVCIGIVMVASSSIPIAESRQLGSFHHLRRHLVFLLLGGIAMWSACRIELHWLERWHDLLLLLALVLLAAVFLPGLGMRINGSQRWLNLGISSFQPVELVKLVLVVYIASYLVRHRDAVEQRFFGAAKPVLVAGLFCALLILQPDFGSAVLLIAASVAMIWIGGARLRSLVMLGAPLLPASAGLAVSESYRVKRFSSFLDPWKDPFDGGFQLTQSLIAVGRGEWFGVGLGASVQKLYYLPEAHTDFILAVIAEELGLAGVILVLGLYTLLMVRGLQFGLRGIAVEQRFAAFVAFGVSIMIGLQALVSVGVNLGVLPTSGLTLPLISAGGSSVVLTCAMLGLLLRAGFEITRAERQRAVGGAVGAASAEAAA